MQDACHIWTSMCFRCSMDIAPALCSGSYGFDFCLGLCPTLVSCWSYWSIGLSQKCVFLSPSLRWQSRSNKGYKFSRYLFPRAFSTLNWVGSTLNNSTMSDKICSHWVLLHWFVLKFSGKRRGPPREPGTQDISGANFGDKLILSILILGNKGIVSD